MRGDVQILQEQVCDLSPSSPQDEDSIRGKAGHDR